ncbi:MAG: SDR family oxidoreductase [Sedimentisphaerales bacterium]|nr:SDR family oxidoreductase [Sedimentisphaerales bacterium]
MDLFDLTGKRALITGSSRGIGYTIAEGLASAGAEIILNSRHQGQLDAAVEKLRATGATVAGRCFDVAEEKAVPAAIAEIEEAIGPIDILVNNAGINLRAPLAEYPLENWHTLMSVNLTGVFVVTQAVVRYMIPRRCGKIINICSANSEVARPIIGPYSASKGAVKMLTKAMAVEWAQYNIQANGLGPGYFLTELTKPIAANPEFDQAIRGRTPAGKWGDVEDLKGPAIFLASAASDFVNGHILFVDGGFLASA